MKKLVTFAVLATMLATFAFPVFAQDEVVLTGGDIDSLLGGGNNRNRGNNNQPQIPDPVYLFEDVKALLKNNKVPLDKNQEKSLQTFLTTETAAIRTALEAQFTNRGNNGGRGGNNNQTMITDLEASVTKHNAALLTEIKAALTPDQVSLIAKAEKDNKKVCTVMVDLVNFQALAARFQNEQNNFRGRGGGGPGGFEGGGLDIIGLDLGGGGGGGGNNGFPGNRGGNQLASFLPNRASCTSKDSTPAQRIAVLGDILTKGKKPLAADQLAKFEPMADTHVKAMVEELKTKDQQIERFVNDLNNQIKNNNNQNNQNQTQQPPTVNVQTLTNNIVNTIMSNLGIQTNNNNNQNNRGGRGNQNNQNQNNNQAANNQPANQPANQNANQNQNNQNFQNFQNNRGNNNNGNFNIQAEVQKKSEELMDKLAASLKPEQAPFIKKMKWDQIKAKGGVDKYRAILESEGTPLTAEQVTQIQNLINAEGQAVRAAAQTLVQKEIQALPEGALQAAALQYQQEQQRQQQQQQNPQQNRNNNNQQNNVNQNQEAQKIIAKVLPEVSKRHAQLLGATQDAILKVMTPPQQASYKINTMTVK